MAARGIGCELAELRAPWEQHVAEVLDEATLTMPDATAADHPPAHLLLGSDALGLVRGKLAALQEELAAWETVTKSTDG